MAALPYVPTWVLSPDPTGDLLYILQPSVTNLGSFELLTLNTSKTFDVATIPFVTLLPQTPFINDGHNAVILPALDGQGNMLVYTGDCAEGSHGGALWQFTPTKSSLDNNGTWQEVQLSTSSSGASLALDGPNYLASAVAFSSTTNASAGLYIFGGMCPNTTGTSTASDWTQNAEYSNNMLTLEPSRSSSSSTSAYNLSISISRGPPVAEAGFSITALAATVSESSDNQTQSVNQNLVLVGGHTEQAFINMSQVALFSLPEQTWSFISVDAPSTPPPTDLAARATNSIDSRSGHSAILTPDGNKVIIFGGWVGDVTTPADPQLAILELGQGYGGSGSWKWAVPTASGSGLPVGTGIYGHGAVMIAGDVMLVMGGYEIPTSSPARQRRATPSANTNNFLFNTSSSSFITSYTHPAVSDKQSTSGSDTTTTEANERIGLGVGLTLGILALIGLVVIYFWYSRRLKRRRDAREDELRNLAAGAHRFHLTGQDHNDQNNQPEMTQTDLAGEDDRILRHPHPWNVSSSASSTINSLDPARPEAARTGLLFEIPSPTRGLRKSLHSRGTYQPAPRYDDGLRGPVNTIHPIDERDEYDRDVVDENRPPGNDTIHRRDFQLLSNVPVLDPFQDPSNSRTPSPQSPQEREAEIRGWVNDWNEADAWMNTGRLSPEKTDRTSSTLSDVSARSMQSYSSNQRSAGGFSRTVSQRSAGVFSSVPLRSTNNTTPQDDLLGRSNSSQQRHGHGRSRSMTSYPVPPHVANDSDTPAATDKSFLQLQHEGDALLGDYATSGDTSPTKIGRRAKGWMGSMRRVFTGSDRTESTSPENTLMSPSALTKANVGANDMPRRAASTGGMLWQKRQGAKDWDTAAGGMSVNESAVGRPGEGDEDWDVESAVERRVVQVMFTVPKEKLRVVNKGPDGDGESVMSSKYEDAIEGDVCAKVEKGKEKQKEVE